MAAGAVAGPNASDPMGLQAAMGGPGMGGGGGMGGMHDPEQMREMMNSPMMASFMNNPDLMRSVIQNNPQVSPSVLNLRTTTSQKCEEAVPMRARISGS